MGVHMHLLSSAHSHTAHTPPLLPFPPLLLLLLPLRSCHTHQTSKQKHKIQQACQLRLCRAFAVIYKISNNLTDPWDNERGWQATATVPCERLTAGTPRQATYCSWFGVTCCTPDAMRAGECSAVNTVMALDLPINNLNVSLENPQLLPNLKVLHDCGMRVLNLEANNIIGALSDDWGQLNKLTVFNFGEQSSSSSWGVVQHGDGSTSSSDRGRGEGGGGGAAIDWALDWRRQ